MSLILRSDTVYTGTVRAKHLLTFLTTPSSKTAMLTKMLESIGADTTYVTDTTSPTIVEKLLTHVERIQGLGANLLSLEYTLKAIVFVLENSLSDSDYIAVSADFGVSADSDGIINNLYSLDGRTLVKNPFRETKLQLDNWQGGNVVRSWDETIATGDMRTETSLTASEGLIMGQCLLQNKPLFLPGLAVLNAAKTTEFSAASLRIKRDTASYIMMYMPTTSFTAAKSFTWGAPSKESLQKAGVVSLYDYGTVNNKLMHNGSVVIDKTEGFTSYNLASMPILLSVGPNSKSNGLIEIWLINSNSTPLAVALSNHLNRQ